MSAKQLTKIFIEKIFQWFIKYIYDTHNSYTLYFSPISWSISLSASNWLPSESHYNIFPFLFMCIWASQSKNNRFHCVCAGKEWEVEIHSDIGNIKLNYAKRMTLCFLVETEKIAIFLALMTSQFIWEKMKKKFNKSFSFHFSWEKGINFKIKISNFI